MHWRIGALICAVRGHKDTLWSRPPGGAGPIVFCLRCGVVLRELG